MGQAATLFLCVATLFANAVVSYTGNSAISTIDKEIQDLFGGVQELRVSLNRTGVRGKELQKSILGLKAQFEGSVASNRRMGTKDRFAEAKRLQIIEEMLKHPRAIIFGISNFQGSNTSYDYLTSVRNTCHALQPERNKVQSIETFGSCVRLYFDNSCYGHSVAVYPGSSANPADLSQYLSEYLRLGRDKTFMAIGPCGRNEFKFAAVTRSGAVVKPTKDFRTIPDLYNFSGTQTPRKEYVDLPDKGLYRYYKESRGWEHFKGHSSSIHGDYRAPNRKGRSWLDSQFWKGLEKAEGDSFGYVFPLELGNSIKDDEENLMAQSPGFKKEWGLVTSEISEYHKEHPSVYVFAYVKLLFERSDSTRPFAVSYFFNFNFNRMTYGVVYNN